MGSAGRFRDGAERPTADASQDRRIAGIGARHRGGHAFPAARRLQGGRGAAGHDGPLSRRGHRLGRNSLADASRPRGRRCVAAARGRFRASAFDGMLFPVPVALRKRAQGDHAVRGHREIEPVSGAYSGSLGAANAAEGTHPGWRRRRHHRVRYGDSSGPCDLCGAHAAFDGLPARDRQRHAHYEEAQRIGDARPGRAIRRQT